MALGLRGDQADAEFRVCVQRVREHDLAGLEFAGVGDVAFGCEGEPDGRFL